MKRVLGVNNGRTTGFIQVHNCLGINIMNNSRFLVKTVVTRFANWNKCDFSGHLHLMSDPHKMSKSKRNTIDVTELLENTTPNVFRFYCLMSPYRDGKGSFSLRDCNSTIEINSTQLFAMLLL